MIFTVDRLQIVDGKFIAFEFFNCEKDKNLIGFNKEKIKFIKNNTFCDKYHGIGYNITDNSFKVHTSIFLDTTIEIEKKEFDWEQYASWFKNENTLNPTDSSHSKALGSATSNIGDPYVQSLLNSIHNDDYPKIDFSGDDSGLDITIKALNGTYTAGFDLDMYEPTEKIVIEFLKRENTSITNLTAHPVRYPWNHQKFLSLWETTQHLNGTLYLVNYSDDHNESISVIEVIEMDTSGAIKSDVGYKFDNREDLLAWLKLINTDVTSSKTILPNKPREIRNKDFWEKYQEEENLFKQGKQPYNKIKSKIGKEYY